MSEYVRYSRCVFDVLSFVRNIFVVVGIAFYIYYCEMKTNSEMLLMWHIEQKPVVGRHAFRERRAAIHLCCCVERINRPEETRARHTQKNRQHTTSMKYKSLVKRFFNSLRCVAAVDCR